MAQWTTEGMESAFADRGWLVRRREIQDGIQFDLKEGVKVNLYHTGKFWFGGPNNPFKTEVEAFVNSAGENAASTLPTAGDASRVFVVYGHDTTARKDLELILRRIEVTPIILQNIPGAGDTIIEKLESLTNADFACVLLTPDDVGAIKAKPDELRPRARQNVVLELGMVLSRLGRHRVAILMKGNDLEKPSDIDGLMYIQFNDEVKEAATELAATLDAAEFKINIRGLVGL